MASGSVLAKCGLYAGVAIAGAAAVQLTYMWFTSPVECEADRAEEGQQQDVAPHQAEQLQDMQHEQKEQESAAEGAHQVHLMLDSDATFIIEDLPEDISLQEDVQRMAANQLQLVDTTGRFNIRTMGQFTWRPMRLTVPTLGLIFTSAPRPSSSPLFTPSRPLTGFRPVASSVPIPSFRPRASVKPFLALPRSPRQSWEDDTVEVQDTFNANPAHRPLDQDTQDAIEVNCPAYQLEQKVIQMKVDMATIKQQHAMELYLVSSELLAQKQAVLDTCQQQQVLLAQATVDRQNLEFLLSLPQVQQLLAQAQGA